MGGALRPKVHWVIAMGGGASTRKLLRAPPKPPEAPQRLSATVKYKYVTWRPDRKKGVVHIKGLTCKYFQAYVFLISGGGSYVSSGRPLFSAGAFSFADVRTLPENEKS